MRKRSAKAAAKLRRQRREKKIPAPLGVSGETDTQIACRKRQLWREARMLTARLLSEARGRKTHKRAAS